MKLTIKNEYIPFAVLGAEVALLIAFGVMLVR